ncbi:MAG: hypothetical protein Q9157_003323 [Trypethelium eluteriae]
MQPVLQRHHHLLPSNVPCAVPPAGGASDFVWEPIDERLVEAADIGGGALRFMSTYGCIYHLFRSLCLDEKEGLGNGKTVFCPPGMSFNIDCGVTRSGPTYQHIYRRWCEANTVSGELYDKHREKFHNLITITTNNGDIINPKLVSACQAAASTLVTGSRKRRADGNPLDMQSLVKSAETKLAQWRLTQDAGTDHQCNTNEYKIIHLSYTPGELWIGVRQGSKHQQLEHVMMRNLERAGEMHRDADRGPRFVNAGHLAPERLNRFPLQYGAEVFDQFSNHSSSNQSRSPHGTKPITFRGIPSSFAEYARAMEQMQFINLEKEYLCQDSFPESRRQNSFAPGILSLEAARRVNGRAQANATGSTQQQVPDTFSLQDTQMG